MRHFRRTSESTHFLYVTKKRVLNTTSARQSTGLHIVRADRAERARWLTFDVGSLAAARGWLHASSFASSQRITMRAVVYDAARTLPEVREVADPDCPSHGAVVRVGATGICRSDWHAWMGHDVVALPHVPGHELAGVVQTIGSEVTRWAPGDRVTVPFVCACGSCPACLQGDHQVCLRQTQPGFSTPGSFAELVALHHADVNLVALPDGIDDVTAATLGCRFATSYRAVAHLGAVREGEWIAVHGCGGVGLAAVMIARARGARVIAVDVSREPLEWAQRLGAERLVDARDYARPADVGARIRELSAGGAHVSVDALGSRSTVAAALAGLRPRGRHVQVGLLLGAEVRPPVDMGLVVARELQVFGSHGMSAAAYPQMLAEIEAGRLRPEQLVATVIGLDAAPAALVSMGDANRGPGVTVVVPHVGQPN
jgi:alcohol dehydrogenase